ncbi:hypothetical protein OG2516_14800 [Oceanicola granulosus HTCC2516]|uniref:Uncharacterized protein n=1 Tax=Oceanicola granulosus (strain ATCC BAA-861 / DSM 15982 / KCTC 12143 / HTCC2516) TaxID=314256 RepID=Q2CEV5_OCEGH|nr:hypothetical protein [Oceanicola granulosus]EAR51153.1 hypothetical protein OG2516_14800 [Oceanicola granulosus HTCC2516]
MDKVADRGLKPTFSSLALTFEPDGGEFNLQAVTVAEGDARIAITFADARPLAGTLRDHPARAMRRLLLRAEQPTGIWSFPDERVVLRELILSEPRLIVSRRSTGASLYVLRFQRFFGQLLGLFDPAASIANPLRVQLDELAFRTIESAMLPLFNIAEHLERGETGVLPEEALQELLQQLRTRIDNLHLHYLVLSQALAHGRPAASARLSQDLMDLVEPDAPEPETTT